jgi:hypothetical protein
MRQYVYAILAGFVFGTAVFMILKRVPFKNNTVRLVTSMIVGVSVFTLVGLRPEGFAAGDTYSDSTVYSVGDVVTKDGVMYAMVDGVGAPGYPPPRPTNWRAITSPPKFSGQTYDSSVVYNVGDIVTGTDGVMYAMIDGIGAPGYPPPRPTNWRSIPSLPKHMFNSSKTAVSPYNPSTIYKVGDVVTGPDGIMYAMIDGIGAPGYPPPRPTNWRSITAAPTHNGSQYSDTIIYNVGDKVRGPDGMMYAMIDGIGAPGYPPPRPTNWKPIV